MKVYLLIWRMLMLLFTTIFICRVGYEFTFKGAQPSSMDIFVLVLSLYLVDFKFKIPKGL